MARTGRTNIVQNMVDGTFFVYNEVPTGTVNGSNTTFTLAFTPAPADELRVLVNGQRLKAGGEDFTLSGDTLTMNTAPPTNSILMVDYHVSP